MSKKNRKSDEKIDISKLDELRHSPFASLGQRFGVEESDAQPVGSENPENVAKHPRSISVQVRLERRKYGKRVTVIRQFQGDGDQLLRELRRKFATGGQATGTDLELQGDHVDAACTYFESIGIKTRR